jgi:hypothetical protein
MKKLRWVEVEGMKYVAVDASNEDCGRCVFDDDAKRCEQINECQNLNFIPLEVQHIPFLRVRGKTKWRN